MLKRRVRLCARNAGDILKMLQRKSVKYFKMIENKEENETEINFNLNIFADIRSFKKKPYGIKRYCSTSDITFASINIHTLRMLVSVRV